MRSVRRTRTIVLVAFILVGCLACYALAAALVYQYAPNSSILRMNVRLVDLLALQVALHRQYPEAPAIEVGLNDGRVLRIDLINSPLSRTYQFVRENQAGEIAKFSAEHFTPIAEIRHLPLAFASHDEACSARDSGGFPRGR